MNKTPEQIVALVRDAGVIGAAGMGFPTHVKLTARAETVIINGSECEPLLYTDKTLLRDSADDIVQGLRLAMIAVGAHAGVIAINCEDDDGIAAVDAAIAAVRAASDKVTDAATSDNVAGVNVGGLSIRIHLMGNYYPAGDEMLTVYDITGKVVPEGGTPLDVGAMVLNAATAAQIYRAVNGIAVTERVITIAGAVKEPKVVTVPIGARYSELIALAGGPSAGLTLHNVTVLDGGPMMGHIVADLEEGIGKSTSAIIVLPTDHHVIQMKSKSLTENVAQSKTVSGQRTQSTDLCPRYLLGHEIEPHQAMIALDYARAEPSAEVTSAFLCSGCGICEMVGDEAAFTSPKKIYSEFKSRLLKAGVKNPHTRSGFVVHSQYQNRKLAIPTLVMKLGIGDYVCMPARGGKKQISLVRVPTRRHVGVAALTTIALHQLVRRGDVIAASPADDLGALYQAPIHGQVSDITDDFIEITGEAS